jgi:hypothetical protein
MIKKEDAFPVFLPNPAIAKSNIDNMIDKNKPPEIKKILISVSVQTNPDSIITNPDIPKHQCFSSILPPTKLTQ